MFGRVATEIAIGQGCSAATLPLPDSRVSMFAGGVADRLQTAARRTSRRWRAPSAGRAKGRGISTDWIETPVLPRIVLEGGHGQVRISPAVDAEINAEIARRPGSETGGIIFGRYCDVTDSFHVVGTLPAPPDSKFSAEEFVLGTKGLRPVLADLIEGSGGALYPLGHLAQSSDSERAIAEGHGHRHPSLRHAVLPAADADPYARRLSGSVGRDVRRINRKVRGSYQEP